MDDISKKREDLFKLYPNPTWRDKVKRMSEGQVRAIWLRNKEAGKI